MDKLIGGKKFIFAGLVVEKPKRTKNLLKLELYLPFGWEIQKWKVLEKKPEYIVLGRWGLKNP